MLDDSVTVNGESRITNQLAVGCVLALVTALSIAAISWVALRAVADSENAHAESMLRDEIASRKDTVLTYLTAVRRDIQNTASSRLSSIILGEFESGFTDLGEDARQHLQNVYIAENPNPVGRKQTLLKPADGSNYSEIHSSYHDWFLQLAVSHDYYDLFMVSADGDVLYTVYKEDDFATNLNSGPYKDTELASIFASLRENPRAEAVAFSDFFEYSASGNLPAAFIGSPVLANGQFQGAFIAQLKLEPFKKIMESSRLEKESGEIYLVGPDHLLRSTSRIVANMKSLLDTRIESASVDAALANKSGVGVGIGSREVPVLSAYAPLKWNDLHWAVVAEIDYESVRQTAKKLQKQLLVAGILLTLLAFFTGWLLADRKSQQ